MASPKKVSPPKTPSSFSVFTTGPIIAPGFSGVLALVFGVCLAGSFIEIALSRFIPLVSGIIVTLIGLSLIKVGIISCAGGFGAENFGSFRNLALAFGVLALIVLLNGSRNSVVRMMAIVIGLTAIACNILLRGAPEELAAESAI